ncbi:MAG: cobalamin-dependent protein [Candidatus Bathyarchaeia archaeon]
MGKPDDLVNALADLKEEEALRLVKDLLNAGEDPFKIMDYVRRGMEIVGNRFANSEYFISDLIYAGEILKEITALIKPKLAAKEAQTKKLGKIVIGTVAGDIHDIGKDIVVFMLEVNGFEVYDLGVDVPEEKFVEKIRETGATIVGLSGFLTLAFDSMKRTVEAIEKAGLRDKVKIMIGGGQITEEVKRYVGADAYGKDAMEAVALAKKWVGVK